MKDVFKLPVFLAADVFPMMTDDELQELAADIKANGLHEPLVVAEVDDIRMLVDGRNRREACKIAGVEPTTRLLVGLDPKAFVVSANIHRRHMTKGQRAMAVAMIYPDTNQGKQSSSKIEEVSATYLSYARTVLKHEPDLADLVLNGSEKLDAAYETAKSRRDASSLQEPLLADLRARYPELADKVVEAELTLAGARAEADERDKRAKEQRVGAYERLAKIVYTDSFLKTPEHIDCVVAMIEAYPGEFETQERFTLDEVIEACEAVPKQIKILAKRLKKRINK